MLSKMNSFSDAAVNKIREIAEKEGVYTDFLKFQGRVFKQNTAVALEFFAQNQTAGFIANAEQWEGIGYRIKSGCESLLFIDEDGNRSELYDFSQVISNSRQPPPVWTMNKETAAFVKSALEISEDCGLVATLTNQTITNSQIAELMELLQVPPNDFAMFRKNYIEAVQTVIAGRFEIGGSSIVVKPDNSVFTELNDNGKMTFFTSVSNTARKLLYRVEKVINETQAKKESQTSAPVLAASPSSRERDKESEVNKNDLRELEEINQRAADGNPQQHEEPANHPVGRITEQSDSVENDSQGRRNPVGSPAEGRNGGTEIPGVQAEGRIGEVDLVQIQPIHRNISHESDRDGTVDGRGTNRELRHEMASVDGGEPQRESELSTATAQVADGSEGGGQEGMGISLPLGQTVSRNEPTTSDLRRDGEVGDNEEILHRLGSDEGSGADSVNDSLTLTKLNNFLSNSLSPDEELLSLTEKIRAKQAELASRSSLIESGNFRSAARVASELVELLNRAAEVRERIQSQKITTEDVQTLRRITPKRKSVMNLLEPEVAQTAKFERLLGDELGELSPYELRKRDARGEDDTLVPVVTVEKRDVSNVIPDMKSGVLERGEFVNIDTNFIINLGKKNIDEVITKSKHDKKRNKPIEARLSALYQIRELIENAVFLDSQVSEPKKENSNTLFMHRMYGVFNYAGEIYLANFAVEEMYRNNDDISDTHNRLYSFRDMKITPLRELDDKIHFTPFEDGSVSQGVTSISITQLRSLVKRFDKNFYENFSAVGRTAREAEIAAHESYENAVTNLEKADTNVKTQTTVKSLRRVESRKNSYQGSLFDLEEPTTPKPKVYREFTVGEFIEYSHNNKDISFWEVVNVNEKGNPDIKRLGEKFPMRDFHYFNVDYRLLSAEEIEKVKLESLLDSLTEKIDPETTDLQSFIGKTYIIDRREMILESVDENSAKFIDAQMLKRGFPISRVVDIEDLPYILENYELMKPTPEQITPIDKAGEDVQSQTSAPVSAASPSSRERDEVAQNPDYFSELVKEYGEETAHKLREAFDNSRQADYESGLIKQRLIKKALDNVLEDGDETEKAFTIITGIRDPKIGEYIEYEGKTWEITDFNSYQMSLKEHGADEYAIVTVLDDWRNRRDDFKFVETPKIENVQTVAQNPEAENEKPKLEEPGESTREEFLNDDFIETSELPEMQSKSDQWGDSFAPESLAEIVYADNPHGKFNDNISALRELDRIESAIISGRNPYNEKWNTIEGSHEILSRYSGWGGLPQVFDEYKTDWRQKREELRNLLTEDEYTSARESTLNAHYTPQVIIDAMYTAVKNMNLPRDARILEPSCGTGNFIRRLPAMFCDSEVIGVELDPLTARIAKHLNPNAKILQCGFEETNLDNNSFHLAVGNVPFGDYKMLDKDYKNDWLIHDAFFRKALDKVAPGGVVAFVTSSGTLDKKNPRVREYLATQADLVGAIRLPNNAFSAAGTKVTADIIFLKKRETPLQSNDKMPSWCYVGTALPTGEASRTGSTHLAYTTPNADGLKINSYFVANPQMVLGKMEQTAHFNMLTCVPHESAKLSQQLNEAIKNINAKITVNRRKKAFKRELGVIEAVDGVKNFTFTKHTDGKFYYRNGMNMTEVKTPAKDLPQLEALCNLRTQTRLLLDKQKQDIADSELLPIRDELNRMYDDFRVKYGFLTSPSVIKIFNDDADFPILQSLERLDEESKIFVKADIFTRRTVNAQIEISNTQTVEEALQISLDRRGCPDIHYMAELLDEKYVGVPTKQVVERVYSELLEKQLCFIDPEKAILDVPYSGIVERSEYLSGNVRQKFKIAEINNVANGDYTRNITALQGAIPEDIKAENISVRMGAPWIEAADYTRFLKELSGGNRNSKTREVHYSPVTGVFEIVGARAGRESLSLNESTTYGTPDFTMYQLAEKVLNQRQIVVKREYPDSNDPSKMITKTDHKATKIAHEKANKIREEFGKWVWQEPARKAKYEQIYNNTFNCLVGREYDGSKLTFPGMITDFEMRSHQKNAIARGSMGENTLIAHEVGAGKSAVIFATVMRKKQLGLINKACVVVPKSITEQIAREWRKLYPDARILTVTADDLSNESKRNLFTARCATGSYDAVVLSFEQFEKIPMSREHREEYMRKQLDSLQDILKDRKRENGGKSDPTTKEIEKAKKRLQTKLTALLNPKGASKAKDNLLEFEQLGFDYLVADEAQAFKNGFVMTKMTNVSGVTTRTAGRAEDMQMKCDYFNENYGQGHILMSTGTPVSNSMTELYVMTRYLRPDLLEQAGVSRFDDWASVFGNVTTALEPTAYETYKLKTRFSQFANLPELMAFYKEFSDIMARSKLQLPRPALKNGKNTIINVPATPEQKAYVRELSKRAEAINSGNVKPHIDNFLKITSEARLVGLGNQAVKSLYARRDEESPIDFTLTKNSKTDACVDNVYNIWKDTSTTKGVQLIFSDIAVNADNGNFSVYDYIKAELISKGIPAEQIIFAPKSDAKNREEIFEKINSGEYRVVIASTGTLGTGCNIQQKLTALHHCDIPWKPSDFEQREGRILRQGNENPEVEIFNYVTEGTLDSYLYSTVTNKARFIAQILDNDCPARVSEDCDEKVLTYAEIQAIAAGNTDIRDRIETANSLAELHMLKREWGYENARLHNQIEVLPEKIADLEERLVKIQADKVEAAKIGEVSFSNEFLQLKVSLTLRQFKGEDKTPIHVGTVGSFVITMTAERLLGEPVVHIHAKGEYEYFCEAGMGENSQNSTRLENLLKNIPKREMAVMAQIEQHTLNLEQAQSQVGKPFEHEEAIVSLTAKLDELDKKLSGITEQKDVIGDPEEELDPHTETQEEKSKREQIYSVGANDSDDYQPVPEEDLPDNDKGRKR